MLRMWRMMRRFWPLTILIMMGLNFAAIWFISYVDWDLAIAIGVKCMWFYLALGVYIIVRFKIYVAEEHPEWDDLTFEEKAYVRELERQNARDMINRGEIPKRVRKYLK